MKQISDRVRKFFEDYETGGSALDLELLAAQYGDPFMFAGPQGVQAVKMEDFLKALPNGRDFSKQSV